MESFLAHLIVSSGFIMISQLYFKEQFQVNPITLTVVINNLCKKLIPDLFINTKKKMLILGKDTQTQQITCYYPGTSR